MQALAKQLAKRLNTSLGISGELFIQLAFSVFAKGGEG